MNAHWPPGLRAIERATRNIKHGEAAWNLKNDYCHMLDVLHNRRPPRLPVYEHIISPLIMEQVLGVQFAALSAGDPADLEEFFTPLLPLLAGDDLRHRLL